MVHIYRGRVRNVLSFRGKVLLSVVAGYLTLFVAIPWVVFFVTHR